MATITTTTNDEVQQPSRLAGWYKQQKQQQVSVRLAKRWTGKVININSCSWRGGSCYIGVASPSTGGGPVGHNTAIRTSEHDDDKPENFRFLVEEIPNMPGVVAFRFHSSTVGNEPLYLTNIMYGDEARQEVAAALASVPHILADNIGTIVDYAVGRPTEETNFEGAGFNYSPMMLQRGTPEPNKLQMFRLERSGGGAATYSVTRIGIQSLFGTYWRSQWWDHTVSQSPHLKGDEEWYFQIDDDDDDEYYNRKENPLFGQLQQVNQQQQEEEEEDEDEEDKGEETEEYKTAMEQARKALGFGGFSSTKNSSSNSAVTVVSSGPTPTPADAASTNPPFSFSGFVTDSTCFQVDATKSRTGKSNNNKKGSTSKSSKRKTNKQRNPNPSQQQQSGSPSWFAPDAFIGTTPVALAAVNGSIFGGGGGSPFSFGNNNTTATTTTTAGVQPTTTTNTTGFSFGDDASNVQVATTATTTNTGAFRFGDATTTAGAAGTQQATGFTFGTTNTMNNGNGIFSFGTASAVGGGSSSGSIDTKDEANTDSERKRNEEGEN